MVLRGGAVLLLILTIGLGVFAYGLLKPAEKQDVTEKFSGLQQVTFLMIGDQGVGNLRQWQVADAMERFAAAEPTTAVFFLGDNFYSHGVASPEDLQWRYKFENVYTGSLASTPFFATLGNHDYYGNSMAQLAYDREDKGSTRWQMPARDYLKTFGGDRWNALVRVAFIDTGLYVRNPADAVESLDQLLSQASPASWTIVVTHAALVTGNEFSHQPGAIEAWQPVLRKHRVDAVLAGHDHNMQFLRQGGWPASVIVGVGGKSGQALEIEDVPGLEFFGSETGFGALQVDHSSMHLKLMNTTDQVLFEHRWQRSQQGL